VYDLETGVPSLVTADIANFAWSSWSPDGRRLAFVAGDDTLRIVVVGAAQPPRVLDKGAVRGSSPAWTPDGRRIVFIRSATGTTRQIVEIDPDGAEPARVLGAIDGDEAVSVSPNGRWLAYVSDGAVSVTDYPALAVRQAVTSEDSAVPQWSPDGSAV
jgi:Tol biopolymer transport system component